MPDTAQARALLGDRGPVPGWARILLRIAHGANDHPFGAAISDEPQRRIDLGVALPGHQLAAFLFEQIPHRLNREVLQLPGRHLDRLVRNERGRGDGPFCGHVEQSPSRRRRLPAAWRFSHGHHARVAPAPVGNCTERLRGAGGKWGDALDVEADKEKLVAKPERQVFQYRGVKMRPQPVDRALTLLLEVPSGSLPTLGEVWRYFVHRDLVHRILPDRRPRRREPRLA